jgi:hypothetical protein
MPLNLILHGGIYHDFAAGAQAIAGALAPLGIRSELATDVEAVFERLRDGDVDMLTVYALRWRMLDHEKYEPFRAEYAMSVSAGGRAALEDFVRGGGALLALHTASICFDDWPGWGEVLGARWRWGQSFHPAPQTVQVRVEDPTHAVSTGITDFEVEDEIFHALEATDAIHALLSARATPDSPPQPMLWARRHGAGRVVYDALGHTVASISHPVHQRVLQQAARWLTQDTAGASR